MPSLIPRIRTLALFLLAGAALAQAPSFTPKPYGNLKQVMRAVALPNSDIIFAIQQKPPKTDMEWQAVVNAAVSKAVAVVEAQHAEQVDRIATLYNDRDSEIYATAMHLQRP